MKNEIKCSDEKISSWNPFGISVSFKFGVNNACDCKFKKKNQIFKFLLLSSRKNENKNKNNNENKKNQWKASLTVERNNNGAKAKIWFLEQNSKQPYIFLISWLI